MTTRIIININIENTLVIIIISIKEYKKYVKYTYIVTSKMKRPRDDIVNDIIDTKNMIEELKKTIAREEENIIKYTIELDNCDIEQHKLDTIKQFNIWKTEFNAKFQDSSIEQLLNNFSITEWDVKCHISTRQFSPYKRRLYTNNISMMLNYELFLDFSVDSTTYFPNTTKFTLWHIDDTEVCIDLAEITNINQLNLVAQQLKINTNTLFELIAFIYHTFMFDPKCPAFKYLPANELSFINKLINHFGQMRCHYSASFFDRYCTDCTFINKEEQLKKIIDVPTADFDKLY